MIFHSTYGKWNCPFFTNNATNIFKHTIQIFDTHGNTCDFGMKNNVGK